MSRHTTIILTLAAALACGRPGPHPAQLDPDKVPAFHAYVRDLFSHAGQQLPAGDTAVAWSDRGPILYFTASVSHDSIASGMVRNDGLVGSAIGVWSGGKLLRFQVLWTRGDSAIAELSAATAAGRLVLSGTRDTSFLVPALPWAIADYGSEDQLIPLFWSVADRPGPVALAILRPYGLKWDTVAVRAKTGGEFLVVRAREGTVDETYVIDVRGRLVLLQRHDQAMERRPLEGSSLYSIYPRALAAARAVLPQ